MLRVLEILLRRVARSNGGVDSPMNTQEHIIAIVKGPNGTVKRESLTR